MRAIKAATLCATALFATVLTLLSVPHAQALSEKRLTIGISQFPSTLHPSFDSMLAKSYVVGLAHRPITVYDADWNQTCLVCTELPDLEKGTARHVTAANGEPGMEVTYTLMEDAVWGDGTPITARDVAFSWEVGRHPKVGIDAAELFNRIDRVEIESEKRFTLHYNKRTCEYQGITNLNLLPAHLEKELFDNAPADYRKRSLYNTEPSRKGLWFGPYRVERIEDQERIILVRNENWWGKQPYFDQIHIRAIENTAALTTALLAGDIDMIAGELGLSTEQALSLPDTIKEDFQVTFQPGLLYEHIDVMMDNPALKDVRVRRALLHAVDRNAISEQLFQGKQPAAHGNVNPLDKWYDPTIPKYGFDPDMAARLLEEAGWTPGPNGLRTKEGKRLTLTLMTTAGNKTRELVQQFLQSQWAAVGIDIRIENEPPQVLFGETIRKRKFPALAMFAWASAPESVPRSTLHSEEIPTAENEWRGQNYTGYASEEMDRIIDDLETECTDEDQTRLWSELQHLYAEDLPVLPLYFRANPYILPESLKGLEPTGHLHPSTLWVEEWHLSE